MPLLINLAVLLSITYISNAFEVPDALVEVFQPKGLRVSIPNVDGIKLFAFHGKINEEFEGLEGGTLSRDILKIRNGRWNFYDPSLKLNVGDTLYYWLYVDYFNGVNKLGYQKLDQMFTVTSLLPSDTGSTSPTSTTKKPTAFCLDTPTTVNNVQSCAGKLIFEDYFDDLKNNVWQPEIKYADQPDFEFVVYGNHSKTLYLSNGTLNFHPVPSEHLYGNNFIHSREGFDLGAHCTGTPGTTECYRKAASYIILPPVASSQVTTKNRFQFKYGRIEIRAKLPKGAWVYPEMFLNHHDYGQTNYESGQLRVGFLEGNSESSKNLHGGCVLGHSPRARQFEMKSIYSTIDWVNDFHIYQLTWTPDSISVGVDDKVFGNIFPPPGGFADLASRLNLKPEVETKWRKSTSIMAPFDREMFLTLGLGVGGHCFEDRPNKPWVNDEPSSQKNFSKSMDQWTLDWTRSGAVFSVDYVKIWAL